MTQDELGWDRLLRAALRRAEPTDAVPEEQDADMGQASLDPAPERRSAAGFIRREDERVLGPVESDQTKSGKARLNLGRGEKRPGREREKAVGLPALPVPQSQSSSSGLNGPMQVERELDHQAADSSAAGKNRGKPKRKPVGAVLLRKLQAAEAAAEGSVCAIEIGLAMEAADRLCADAVALAEAYRAVQAACRGVRSQGRDGFGSENGMGPFRPEATGESEGGDSSREALPPGAIAFSVWRSARCRTSRRGLHTTRPSWRTAACIWSMLAAWRRSR